MSDNKKLFFGLKRSKVDPKERKLSLPQCERIDLPSCFSLKDKVKTVFDLEHVNETSMSLVFRPFLKVCIACDVLHSFPLVFY